MPGPSVNPPCGIGGPTASSGPCTGTLTPSDAGLWAFSGLSIKSAVSTIIAAGAILAGLIFVIWIVRVVARFFGREKQKLSTGGEPGTVEWDDQFWKKHGAAYGDDADFAHGSDDLEIDTEDDSPLELGYESEDAYS